MSEKIVILLGAGVLLVGFATSSFAMSPVENGYPGGTASAGVVVDHQEKVQRQNAVEAHPSGNASAETEVAAESSSR